MKLDQSMYESAIKTEKEKQDKLKTIAGEKYQIDLKNLDAYLPKGN